MSADILATNRQLPFGSVGVDLLGVSISLQHGSVASLSLTSNLQITKLFNYDLRIPGIIPPTTLRSSESEK